MTFLINPLKRDYTAYRRERDSRVNLNEIYGDKSMTEGSGRRRLPDSKGSGDVCLAGRKRLAPFDVGLPPLWSGMTERTVEE